MFSCESYAEQETKGEGGYPAEPAYETTPGDKVKRRDGGAGS